MARNDGFMPVQPGGTMHKVSGRPFNVIPGRLGHRQVAYTQYRQLWQRYVGSVSWPLEVYCCATDMFTLVLAPMTHNRLSEPSCVTDEPEPNIVKQGKLS